MIIEFGEENEEYERHVGLNLEEEPQIIYSFFGCYNKHGLYTLGCRYISRRDFRKLRMIGILRLRHFFEINESEKKRWSNEEELNRLPLEMKAIAKLCLLDDKKLVFYIMKFYV